MLDIVTTTFYIKAPSFKKQEFEHHSTELFDEWDRYVEAALYLPDYSLTLVVEEGSIKGAGKIAASAAALYFAIGNYGDFVSGLRTIKEQASYATNALFDQAKSNFGCSSARGNSKRSGGEIFYLEKLFERVQRGAITPDQAMNELKDRWKDEAASQKFLEDLSASLAHAPPHPEQLMLSDESWDPCLDIDIQEPEPRPSIPRSPDTPVPQHYRIEIHRPSKKEKKKVRLTKVK